MNKKTLTILSGICAVVLIASAYLLTRTPVPHAPIETFGLTKIEKGDIAKIARKDVVGTIEVVQADTGWTIDGTPAATSSIESFIGSLASARATLVAKNGREVMAYGLGATKSTISIVTKAGTTIALDVGAGGLSADSVYVARPDAPEVYLLEGTTLGTLVREDWKTWSE